MILSVDQSAPGSGNTCANLPPEESLSLAAWARLALSPFGQVPAKHHLLIVERLEAVADGRIDRLMLLLPPGHAKSTYASVLFPAWWFTRNPQSSIITACHTASLADHFARRVRDLVRENSPALGYDLVKDDRAASHWRTSSRGDYFATGVRGPITGRRADLVLIDDPVKSHAEADSVQARDAVWNWYRSDLATRLKPGGRIVLVMTRWHEDDLGGRLLESDPSWTVIKLPAFAEPNDPLQREIGEALWPEWEDRPALERKRSTVGSRVWQALFQQNPTPDTDALFSTGQIQIVDQVPSILRDVRAWDLAATLPTEGRDPDWTVGLKLAVTELGQYVVTDLIRLRAGPTEIASTIVATADRDGQQTIVGLPQDPGQSGKQQVAWLTQRLAGHRVKASPETGSKLTRAIPAAASVEAGMVVLLRAPWNRAFLDELRDFPQGRKDDQVDALSRAFSLATQTQTQPRRLTIPLMGR